jgi:Cu2+-exporting ATPase
MLTACRIVHAVPGRLRLRLKLADPNGGLAPFTSFLREQPVVREVRINRLCGSVTLHYDSGSGNRDQLVGAIKAYLVKGLTDRESGGVRQGDRDGQKLASTEHEDNLPVRCHVRHAVPGRLRIRIDSPDLFDGRARGFEAFLRDQPGIQDVYLATGCRSVVLKYDATSKAKEEVVALIERLPLEQLSSYSAVRASPAAPAARRTELTLGKSGRLLIIATMGVVLSLVSRSRLMRWLVIKTAVPVFKRALKSLVANRKLNVDCLDAAATIVLLVRGHFATAAAMLWLISLGDFIRDLTVRRSHRAIEGLFQGRARFAWVVDGKQRVATPIEKVGVGDVVVAYAGELVPVDGIVCKGKALVDQKLLTGESLPVERGRDDRVYAGTAVTEGKLVIRAEGVGAQTAASRIIKMILDAPVHETRIQQYAERFADRFVLWSFLGAGASYLVTRTVHVPASLLIVDFGTGIRVAAPTTVLASLAMAARHGILIKGGSFLETLTQVDAVVFDKTGTLTTGVLEVVEVISYQKGVSIEEILSLAAAVEQRFTHPVAQAVVRTAENRGICIPKRKASKFNIGLGVKAKVNGSKVLVGSDRFMAAKQVDTGRARKDLVAIEKQAISSLFVAADGKLVGLLAYSDPLRREAPAVVEHLQGRGVREVAMLTGDRPAVARAVAEAANIRQYVAETTPQDKLEFVKSLQQKGRTVALVGDGINDSPALAQADVGIAVQGGADVAQETAHVTLLEADLWMIPEAIAIAHQSVNLIRQNWRLNFYPGCAAIILSVLGLVGPVGSTAISNGAAVISTLNALRPMAQRVESKQKAARRVPSVE